MRLFGMFFGIPQVASATGFGASKNYLLRVRDAHCEVQSDFTRVPPSMCFLRFSWYSQFETHAELLGYPPPTTTTTTTHTHTVIHRYTASPSKSVLIPQGDPGCCRSPIVLGCSCHRVCFFADPENPQGLHPIRPSLACKKRVKHPTSPHGPGSCGIPG